ncbi:hypothetical protein XELAEV_18012125mg [Xenopus laevis]|uniref:Chromo domain-containing protein n=1 Tax=Xenopus laevis TaxID=8355 RepID=A0A974DM55_XENLA|nr:hypothetical protein XELAEV_18012125mg [Xenopus laevis]
MEFEVEKILDSRVQSRKLQYLVKWKGFPNEENSWEPEENIHAPRLTKAFHKDHPGRPAKDVLRLSLRGGQFKAPSDIVASLPVRRCRGVQANAHPLRLLPVRAFFRVRACVCLCTCTSCHPWLRYI